MEELLFVILFVPVLTFIINNFIIWLIHWFLHQSYALWLHAKHIEHHSNNGIYDQDNKLLFTIVAIPFLIATVILTLCGIYAPIVGFVIFICALANSSLHDYLHIQFHNKDSWLFKYNWFLKLRNFHFIHHKVLNKNFGVIVFVWDKLFKSFASR